MVRKCQVLNAHANANFPREVIFIFQLQNFFDNNIFNANLEHGKEKIYLQAWCALSSDITTQGPVQNRNWYLFNSSPVPFFSFASIMTHEWDLDCGLRSEGGMYLQTKPKLLPTIFITTADRAAGNATSGELKCDVANTTPNEEFCMPTCTKHCIVCCWGTSKLLFCFVFLILCWSDQWQFKN